ncbi:MAG: S8 family peptidase [Balneolia bacterium]|nr:S8 family peptidase [Balneolia bacterium]
MKPLVLAATLFIFSIPVLATASFAQLSDSDSDSDPTSLHWLMSVPVSADGEQARPLNQDQRLHPLVQRLLGISAEKLSEHARLQGVSDQVFDLYVKLSENMSGQMMSGSWFESGDGLYAARLTMDELTELITDDRFQWITPAGMYEPQLNRARAETGANLVHQGLWESTPLRGDGVLVGIFDSGIDYRHPAFRDPADSTRSRIKYIWDQTLTPQSGEQSPQPPFNYGVLYTRDDIEAVLEGGQPLRTADPTGHGTHVAGIAAGSGPQFTGIAPEADLVIVKGGDQSFSGANVVAATRFFESVSQIYQRPIVGNYSIGGQFAARDGTEPTERAMDTAVQTPGVSMVSAAGNSGAQLRFFEGRAGSDDIILEIPSYTPRNGPNNDRLLVDIWFDSDAPAALEVTSPSGISNTWTPGMSATFADSTDGVITVDNIIHGANGHRRIVFFVGDDVEQYPPAEGTWRLSLINTMESFKSWMVLNTVGNRTISQQGARTDYTVTTPGTGLSTITAGAYVMQNNWLDRNGNLFQIDSNPIESLAFFSGLGPTRDGRMKPEITSPGRFVAAARARESNFNTNITTPGGDYAWLAGTSMATPVVTGAVALLLQAFPEATNEDIKQALMEGARTDSFTGSANSNSWGAGKLNLPGALDYLAGINGGSGWVPMHIYANGRVRVSGDKSFIFTEERDVIVYSLPEFSGVVNGVTLHAGAISDVESPGTRLHLYLVEIEGDKVRRALGEKATIQLANITPQNEFFADFSDNGVLIPEGMKTGILIRLVKTNDDSSAQLELLGREVFLPSSGASTWHLDSETQRLLSRNGDMIYADVSVARFTGSTDNPPPGFSLPFQISLGNNYPNPFNAQTIIPFEIEQSANVRLEVYDVLGRRVSVLVNENRAAGRYEVPFDARSLASGVYIYRLTTDGRVFTEKMLLLK